MNAGLYKELVSLIDGAEEIVEIAVLSNSEYGYAVEWKKDWLKRARKAIKDYLDQRSTPE